MCWESRMSAHNAANPEPDLNELYEYVMDAWDREWDIEEHIEKFPQFLPWLKARFASEPDAKKRATIVRVIWQTRTGTEIDFLSSALSDPADAVWKEALDGLVYFGGKPVLDILEAAKAGASAKKQEWIAEAIEQIIEEEKRVDQV